MAMLLREALGASLRQVRTGQRRTLREVSRAATMSLGYLSEIERGQKEASSELLAAICTALDVSLTEVLRQVGDIMDPSAAGERHQRQLAREDPGEHNPVRTSAHDTRYGTDQGDTIKVVIPALSTVSRVSVSPQ